MITPMQEAAATAREWYLSFVESGFTEDQALRVGCIFHRGNGAAGGDGSNGMTNEAGVHISWGPTVEVARRHDRIRWCFACRAHLPHDIVALDYDEPSYYEPVMKLECSRCKKDRTRFGDGKW